MRLVSTSQLRSDMILAKSIYQNERLILKDGLKDLGRFSEKLIQLGIGFVYVEDKDSEGIEIPDAISEETRTTCKRVLRETIAEFQHSATVDLEDISDAINDIIDDILMNDDVQISLSDISGIEDNTFAHSVSTTVYALLIAKKLNYSRPMLEKLAIGTILHDVGKALLDKEILFKIESLTDDEYDYIKNHTILGYEALQKCPSLSELSRIVALSHHERMDAKGYPHGIPAAELHEFLRVVSVADVYDALTSDRCYRKKWSSYDAVNYLIENAGSQFDTNMVALFISQIAIYPNGAIVRLSDETFGIVKEQNKGVPLRPIVRVIRNNMGAEIIPYDVDLLTELSITILETEIEINQKNVRIH